MNVGSENVLWLPNEATNEQGLAWDSLGLENIHEVIFHPVLVKELKAWLDQGIVPGWVESKRQDETWFQHIVRRGIELAAGHHENGSHPIRLGGDIVVGSVRGVSIKVKFLNGFSIEHKSRKARDAICGSPSANRSVSSAHLVSARERLFQFATCAASLIFFFRCSDHLL